MSTFALINPRSLELQLTEEAAPGLIAISLEHAHAPAALYEVLGAAIERDDRRLGRTSVKYKLSPPEPWLIVLATVMWQGIVAGMSWDVVKFSVSAALRKLRRASLAPAAPSSKKSRTRVGFFWTEYTRVGKRREMFLGLERIHRSHSKRAAPRARGKPAGAAPRRRRR